MLGLVDKMHRRQASRRGREVSRAKAEKGHVTGGRLFGYRNVREAGGHVARLKDEADAQVVVRIFEEIAIGRGFIRVARGLTADGLPSPRPGQGWGASSIRAVIFPPLYRGEIVYGRTRWAHKGGTKVTVAVPEAEWIRVPAPHLPVVTEAQAGCAPAARPDAADPPPAHQRQAVGAPGVGDRVEMAPRGLPRLRGLRGRHVGHVVLRRAADPAELLPVQYAPGSRDVALHE